jgi:hypothetical protein
MNTCGAFADKIMRQLERYGMTDADEARLRRVAALMLGLVQEHRADKTMPHPALKKRRAAS